MKRKSIKARAWDLAADWVAKIAGSAQDLDPAVRAHVLDAVAPSMKRRAAIIERSRRYDK